MHADVERRETDVNMEEEAELRRLDGIAPGDASGGFNPRPTDA